MLLVGVGVGVVVPPGMPKRKWKMIRMMTRMITRPMMVRSNGLFINAKVLPCYPHIHQIDVFSVAPHLSGLAPLLFEADSAVRADGALVVPVDGEPDAAEVAEIEPIGQEEPKRFPAVPLAPISMVPNADA